MKFGKITNFILFSLIFEIFLYLWWVSLDTRLAMNGIFGKGAPTSMLDSRKLVL